MSNRVSNFERSSFATQGGTYICRICGKRTRETGDCESGVGLCRACNETEGERNEHGDTHVQPVEGCCFCDERAKGTQA